MFFYELRIARSHKTPRGTSRTASTEYLEALKPEYMGEKVGKLLANRSVVRVTVQPINQAKYVRKTRRD